jgi:oxygen-independent coproporphyrinogen-3 oxidase
MHLYVHVPFCARRCSYCDFAIAVRRDTPSGRFGEAIRGEWATSLADGSWDDAGPLRSVYFGGGTPSRLDPVVVAGLLHRFRLDRGTVPGMEVTLEANPEDVTAARAEAWVAAGVNRVSLGVQSFHPAVLEWMHRTHTAEQIPEAVRHLRAAGLGNISVDLIYAVPAMLRRDWAADLDAALGLEPTHLSLYGLTVEERTPLARWRARGAVRLAGDDQAAAEYLFAVSRLVEAGFEHYEVSNASQPGFRSRHNSAYWSGAAYLGLGPSSHSALRGRRWWNVREWVEYQRKLAAGEPVRAGEETLTPSQGALEALYLGLRTAEGVPAGRIPAPLRTAWVDHHWAVVTGDRLTLTARGWLRLDALVAAVPDP